MRDLLSGAPTVVAAGVDVFSAALRAQGADVHDLDWRPPGFGDPADLAALALDRRRAAANRTAVERVMAAGSHLVDVRSRFAPELERLAELARDGLVEIEDDGVTLTPAGWYFVRAVAMVFDQPLQSDRARERYSRVF